MTDARLDGYTMTCDAQKIRPDEALQLLHTTYWAKDRDLPAMERIMNNSLNYGMLDSQGYLVAYMRVVTDYETMFYLADVIVDESHRGHSLGLGLLNYMLSDERLQGKKGLLLTRHAQAFYEHVGFIRQGERMMLRDVQ